MVQKYNYIFYTLLYAIKFLVITYLFKTALIFHYHNRKIKWRLARSFIEIDTDLWYPIPTPTHLPYEYIDSSNVTYRQLYTSVYYRRNNMTYWWEKYDPGQRTNHVVNAACEKRPDSADTWFWWF